MSLLDNPLKKNYSSWFKRKHPNLNQAKGHRPNTTNTEVSNVFFRPEKQSSLGSLTNKLVKEVEKMNNSGGGADDRL